MKSSSRSVTAATITARTVVFMGTVSLLISCSGGGSSSSTPSEGRVTTFGFGRGVLTEEGRDVVSPLTLATSDVWSPVSSVRPLDPSIETHGPILFALDQAPYPPVLPRNGIIILNFTSNIEPSSVSVDKISPEGKITRSGSIHVQTHDGVPIPTEVLVQGSRILLAPLGGTIDAWPSSPLSFDEEGRPSTDARGVLWIWFDSNKRILTTRGSELEVRVDGRGEEHSPIALNPGNAALDFIEQNELLPSDDSFNGFLPDDRSPRIIRDHVYAGTFDPAQGDDSTLNGLTERGASFSPFAKGGSGEWAGAMLTLRPGTSQRESVTVLFNTTHDLIFTKPVTQALLEGESYEIRRVERFEPNPLDPIDPDDFDAENPENEANANLQSFLEVRLLDDLGVEQGEPLDLTAPIPSNVSVRVRFDEPIDEEAVNVFDNLFVRSPATSPEGSRKVPGELTLSDRGRALTYRPLIRENGQLRSMHGLSPDSGRYELVLTTVPPMSFLRGRYPSTVIADVIDEGHRAITDLAGRPLAFSTSDFDPDNARVEYRAVLQSEGDETQDFIGTVGHRFRGLPTVVINPDDNEPLGVVYRDEEAMYGPRLGDFNLETRGFLCGSALRFFQKVLDDDNPSSDGVGADPFPFGSATPLGGFLFAPNPNNPPDIFSGIYGARFQHIYRNEDASPFPGSDKLELDLWRLSWAPAGGDVSRPPDLYEDISIHVAHSDQTPKTFGFYTGLGQAFDPENHGNCFYSGTFGTANPNYAKPQVAVVPPGTAYTPSSDALFSPPQSDRIYIPWPAFTMPFAYDNQRSLLIEYRIRPQETPISFRNSFTLARVNMPGTCPLFRVYSLGSQGNIFDPDNAQDPRATCAQGPQSTYPPYGDNSVYYTVFDWVKAISTIDSSLASVAVPRLEARQVEWLEPIIDPPLASLPGNALVELTYQGSDAEKGGSLSPWVSSPSELDGYPYIRFRARIVADADRGFVPCLDSIVLPYRLVSAP